MSKMDSLKSIIENIHPDVVTLNELKVGNPGKVQGFFKELGYDLLIRVRGGIAVAALEKFKIVNATTSNNPKIISGLISGLNIRIIAGYGPQENVIKEDRQGFFDELSTEMQKAKDVGNNPILIGDLNSKIERLEEVQAMSSNGEMLLELLDYHELKVLNFDSKTTGYWTRVQTVCKKEVKSVLD